MKQQRATLIKQRDEYLRKASVLRRELDKLRLQKHELLCEESPPRDSQRILRENAKLQVSDYIDNFFINLYRITEYKYVRGDIKNFGNYLIVNNTFRGGSISSGHL